MIHLVRAPGPGDFIAGLDGDGRSMNRDVERWLKEDGVRFLREVGIRKGQRAVDFGCGAGHYTIPAARLVGGRGIIYAVDRERQALDGVLKMAESEGIRNVVPIHGGCDELGLRVEEGTIDAMLLYDVLHYMGREERRKIYQRAHGVLKEGALLSVYPKHCKSDMPLWELRDRVPADIMEEIEGEGFEFTGKCRRKLMHDNGFETGDVLNFRRRRKKR